MSKKRSIQQQSGERGEAIFKTFALEYGLLPNKVEYDYGVDFLCQVDKQGDKHGEIGNNVIGVNVKASGNKSNRIRATLNKDDLEGILKCDFPVLIALVDVNNRKVYHRFFDIKMMLSFNASLKEGKNTFTLSPSVLNNNEVNFSDELDRICRVDYRERMRLQFASLKLVEVIGPHKLLVKRTIDGSVVLVKADDIFESLKQLPPDKFDEVRNALLCSRMANGKQLHLDPLGEKIGPIINGLASRTVIFHEFNSIGTKLHIKEKSGNIVSCIFERRELGDETSLYHPSGLSIIITAAREGSDRRHYHYFQTNIENDSSEEIFSHKDILAFLSACSEDSTLLFNANDPVGLPMQLIPKFVEFGRCIRDLICIYRELGIEHPKLTLNDLENWEYRLSYGLLAALILSEYQRELIPGFMVDPPPESYNWKTNCIASCICVSLPEGPTLLEVLFNGKIACVIEANRESVVGFQFDKYLECRLLPQDRFVLDEVINEHQRPYLILGNGKAVAFSDKGPEMVKTKYDLPIKFYLDHQA
ncbi:MAG: DUF4365 domain-containing protein [Pseudomonadota bacterium]